MTTFKMLVEHSIKSRSWKPIRLEAFVKLMKWVLGRCTD